MWLLDLSFNFTSNNLQKKFDAEFAFGINKYYTFSFAKVVGGAAAPLI